MIQVISFASSDSDFSSALLNSNMGKSQSRTDLLGHFLLWPQQYLPEGRSEFVKKIPGRFCYIYLDRVHKNYKYLHQIEIFAKAQKEGKAQYMNRYC